MFLTDILGVAVWWPMIGVPLRSLVSTSHHKKKNIQADPRIVHTQSKANTLCHVRGLSHVLTCFWPFNVLPRVSWMVSSSSRWVADTLKQEGTPAMTHNVNTESREEPGWVTSYPVQAILHLEHDNFMRIGICRRKDYWKKSCFVGYFSWLHTLNPTLTCSNDDPEESCESGIHENIAEMKSG